jgi:hypothetical protein
MSSATNQVEEKLGQNVKLQNYCTWVQGKEQAKEQAKAQVKEQVKAMVLQFHHFLSSLG